MVYFQPTMDKCYDYRFDMQDYCMWWGTGEDKPLGILDMKKRKTLQEKAEEITIQRIAEHAFRRTILK